MIFLRSMIALLLLIGTLNVAAPLSAHEFKSGDLLIGHPWTRATPGGAKTAAGYLQITNNGKDSEKLIGASADGVETVEVHEATIENDITKMRQLKDGLEIKPGQTVELKPSSYHLMMIGLKDGFKEGMMIKGALTFAKAGTVPVAFKVEAMGSMSGHEMSGHDMGHKH